VSDENRIAKNRIAKNRIAKHLANTLKHLYINPLEECNLACKICYTKKTKFVLSNQEILDFIARYQTIQQLESVTFCGGEVFLLKDFPDLVNQLTKQNIFVQIISNGTIDRLGQIADPNMVNLIISLDGVQNYHDQNRGRGNFQKSINLLQKAMKLGFNVEIFSIVTQENLNQIPQFEKKLATLLPQTVAITYHPRKPRAYLQKHPTANILGEVAGFNFLNQRQIANLMQTKQTFPPKNLGCYQIALMSNGQIFACCEGIKSIGNLQTDIEELITNFKNRLTVWQNKNDNKQCLGCVEKDFVCGFRGNL